MNQTAMRFVERPKGGARGGKYPIAAMLETASNGQAIEIVRGATQMDSLRSVVSQLALRRGYKAHTVVKNATTLLVWWERKDGEGANG